MVAADTNFSSAVARVKIAIAGGYAGTVGKGWTIIVSPQVNWRSRGKVWGRAWTGSSRDDRG